ncbi:MAG: hypothetical protein ACFHWZ_08280 [Phycisphaerales bacterium]
MTEQPTDPQHHHALDPKRELSALQVFVQIFGGLIGVGLLIWRSRSSSPTRTVSSSTGP